MATDFGKLLAQSEEFKVVPRIDGALAEDFTDAEYDAYLKTLDESLLRRQEGCADSFTYFHLKPSQKVKDALGGQDQAVGIAYKQQQGSDSAPPLATLAWQQIGTALVDVTLDGKSVMPKKDGKPAEEFLVALINNGIIWHLYTALQARFSKANSNTELSKKN